MKTQIIGGNQNEVYGRYIDYACQKTGKFTGDNFHVGDFIIKDGLNQSQNLTSSNSNYDKRV
jgi:hypothetical protein